MRLRFHMTPGSCSTGIHILLEHLELPFEVYVVNLPAGDHRKPEYLAINPKGTIPALQIDNDPALTEFQSIALWLAWRFPRARLLPEAPFDAAQAVDLMNYVVATVHGAACTRIFTPERYLPAGLAEGMSGDARAAWLDAIQAQGRAMAQDALALIEARIDDQGRLFGDALTVADAALFYVTFWADRIELPLPARCAAFYRRMREREVVRRVLAEEGYR